MCLWDMKLVTSQLAVEGRELAPDRVGSSLASDRSLRDAVGALDAASFLLFQKYQGLLERQLARPLPDTFYELTGVRLHVWWLEPEVNGQLGQFSKLCFRAGRCAAKKLPDQCEACRAGRWPRAWDGKKTEQRFAGLCGSENYCACVKVLGFPSVTLTVQQPGPVSCARRRAFLRAVHLTRLVVRDLENTLEAARQFCDLRPLAIKLRAKQACGLPEECRLRTNEAAVQGCGRSQQLVQRMLDYIQENYSRPIQLADVAASVRLGSSYVSTLFSTTLGVTFHHYLEDFRLARAKDILRDPVTRVAEAGYAVGYSNPNHFRNVFTARVGLPPSAWRETPASLRSSAHP